MARRWRHRASFGFPVPSFRFRGRELDTRNSKLFFMFVNFFIHRPVFATVCALLIILAGAVVIPSLPVAQFPNLAPPQVSVNSGYVGASAQTVETAVTQPLEQQI